MGKSIIKHYTITILVILVGLTCLSFVFILSIPEGEQGERADELALKMQSSLGFKAWKNSNWVKWNFPGDHKYVWNKKRNLVLVSWKNYEVYLVISNRERSLVLKNEKEIQEDDLRLKIIEKAWKFFCNDSFWLIAPFKVFDEGVTRSYVEGKDGKGMLLVEYETGGVTPGDSYLWILNEEGVPQGFKMWVSIIPIGGLFATWENWKTFSNGVKISSKHKLLFFFTILIKDVELGETFQELGLSNNPFSGLENY